MCYDGDICAMKQAHIAKLESRNNVLKEELTQAKELLKKIEKIVYSRENEIKRLSKIVDILAEAEQFLKEVEK